MSKWSLEFIEDVINNYEPEPNINLDEISDMYKRKKNKFKELFNIIGMEKKYGDYQPYWEAYSLGLENELDIEFCEKKALKYLYNETNINFIDTLGTIELSPLFSNIALLILNSIPLPKFNFKEIVVDENYDEYKKFNEEMKELWVDWARKK